MLITQKLFARMKNQIEENIFYLSCSFLSDESGFYFFHAKILKPHTSNKKFGVK
mgnify:CR=1 FL=1